jgi:predicted small secreted protein
MKKIAALLAIAFILAGCNTVKGVGQDIQKAGGAIEDAAKKK